LGLLVTIAYPSFFGSTSSHPFSLTVSASLLPPPAECLKNEPRTYNSVQLAQKLEKERSIKRASRPIKTNTKKKGLIWKRARKSHKGKQEIAVRQIKQADLDMLEWAAAAGEIDLKYLDESGFCAWSELLTLITNEVSKNGSNKPIGVVVD